MLLPPLLAILLGITLACTALWVLAEAGRRYSARGTQQRYIFASIERACRYPALVYFAMSFAIEAAWYRDPLLTVTSVAGIAMWGVLYVDRKKNGNDDDFWKDAKKRLTTGLRRAAPVAGAA